jgi:CBS domain-containing protein/flagellar motility protein MotE (MotC chaperone)/sporulation protein YlmC with PRC-barrel domain
VFVARMSGLAVFDPHGDQVGRVRDVVVVFRPGRERPRVIGLVVEVPGRRRVFLPMTRVTSIDGGQVISTGLVNMRRFEQRAAETLVLAELLDRVVQLRDGSGTAVVEDVALEPERGREWVITKLFCRRGPATRGLGGRLRRRGETFIVDIDDVAGLATESAQSAVSLLATMESLKAVDLADVIHDLSSKRRIEVAAALDDEKLADVLEELPEDDQVEILTQLGSQRAAVVLEVMQPDDAADLLSELPEETAEFLLQLMEPDEAEPLRRLLTYDEKTAGGLMTTDPVVLAPESTIAEALAVVRRAELTPALASAVFVCRPPLETPTGKYIGLVHIQRMLREPPAAAVGTVIDKDVEALAPDAPLGRVTRLLATYNLVTVPVVDDAGHLLGAVTVDDVLDHILPEDWRDIDDHDHDPDHEHNHDHDHEYDARDTAAVEAEATAQDRAAQLSRRRGGRHGA